MMKNLVKLSAIAAFMLLGAGAQAGLLPVSITFDGSDCSGAYNSDSVCSIVQLQEIDGKWQPATGEDSVSDIIGKTELDDSNLVKEVYNGYDEDPYNFSWENDIAYSDLTDKDGNTVTSIFDAVAGTWTYTGDAESPIRFWVNKSGSIFTLYFMSDGSAECESGDPAGNTSACLNTAVSVSSGSWVGVDVDPGEQVKVNALSHLSFYNGTTTTTVPEPGTLALLGLGLLGLGAARRRKVA